MQLAILMMSAKLVTPGLLKVNVFLNKGYEIIVSIHGVTNKIFSSSEARLKNMLVCRYLTGSGRNMRVKKIF